MRLFTWFTQSGCSRAVDFYLIKFLGDKRKNELPLDWPLDCWGWLGCCSIAVALDEVASLSFSVAMTWWACAIAGRPMTTEKVWNVKHGLMEQSWKQSTKPKARKLRAPVSQSFLFHPSIRGAGSTSTPHQPMTSCCNHCNCNPYFTMVFNSLLYHPFWYRWFFHMGYFLSRYITISFQFNLYQFEIHFSHSYLLSLILISLISYPLKLILVSFIWIRVNSTQFMLMPMAFTNVWSWSTVN